MGAGPVAAGVPGERRGAARADPGVGVPAVRVRRGLPRLVHRLRRDRGGLAVARAPQEQLDLFAPPPEDEQPLVFQVACHWCDPPRIIDVIPVDATLGDRWPVPENKRWQVAEKFGYL